MTDLPTHLTKRISLTKTQLRTELGAELLSLCESITSDGRMALEEIGALRQWLDDSADCELPAASYLRDVVQRVIADGTITRDECRDVYRAVETVLPLEVRRGAVAARRDIESRERSEAKAARTAELERERAERLRNVPIARANFMVAGCRYEGRPDVIRQHARAGDGVRLVRDRGNRFSTDAIAVVLENGKRIGFVPEEDAGELARLLDVGSRIAARITKVLTGGRSPIPVVDAVLYSRDSTFGSVPPPPFDASGDLQDTTCTPASSRSSQIWWWAAAAAAALLFVAML